MKLASTTLGIALVFAVAGCPADKKPEAKAESAAKAPTAASAAAPSASAKPAAGGW